VASRPPSTPIPQPKLSSTSGQPTVPYAQWATPNRSRGATPAVEAIDAASTTTMSGHRHAPSSRRSTVVAATTSAIAQNTAIASSWTPNEL
jgi:hypothetical protein